MGFAVERSLPYGNDYLVEDLMSLDIWSPEIKDKLIVDNGSIQNINDIPQLIKDKYKTIWEIKQKCYSHA